MGTDKGEGVGRDSERGKGGEPTKGERKGKMGELERH